MLYNLMLIILLFRRLSQIITCALAIAFKPSTLNACTAAALDPKNIDYDSTNCLEDWCVVGSSA